MVAHLNTSARTLALPAQFCHVMYSSRDYTPQPPTHPPTHDTHTPQPPPTPSHPCAAGPRPPLPALAALAQEARTCPVSSELRHRIDDAVRRSGASERFSSVRFVGFLHVRAVCPGRLEPCT